MRSRGKDDTRRSIDHRDRNATGALVDQCYWNTFGESIDQGKGTHHEFQYIKEKGTHQGIKIDRGEKNTPAA